MFKKVFTLVLAASLFFAGCSKDEMDNLASGWFDGKIAVKVEGGSAYNQQFTKVLALINPRINSSLNLQADEHIATGAYANGGFTIELPVTVKQQHLKSIQYYLEEFVVLGVNLTYSNPDARIVDVELFAFDDDNHWYDYFVCKKGSGNSRIDCYFVYVNEDVEITGGATKVSLKQGWNRLYYSHSKKAYTTKAEKDMKWYCSEDTN